jgi:micrococcal nuclease
MKLFNEIIKLIVIIPFFHILNQLKPFINFNIYTIMSRYFSCNYSSIIFNYFRTFTFVYPNKKEKPSSDIQTLNKHTIEKYTNTDAFMSDDILTQVFHPINSILDLPNYNNIDYKSTMKFVPPVYFGKVIKVYDGDTITIASKLPYNNSPMYRFAIRLNGINSPEIKGKTTVEKDLAKISRDKLNHLIFGKIVVLKNTNTEKYGRILADVYYEDIHINKWMLDNKLAVPYDGGMKQIPDEWTVI